MTMDAHRLDRDVALAPNVSGAAKTHTGVGWGNVGADSRYGVRNDGSYARIGRWPAYNPSPGPPYIGGFLKYSDVATQRSVSYGPDDNPPSIVDNILASFATQELICESCHNFVVNAVGENNLLGPAQSCKSGLMTPANPYQPICVNCHGFMYPKTRSTPRSRLEQPR
jgi:hypothetical protein